MRRATIFTLCVVLGGCNLLLDAGGHGNDAGDAVPGDVVFRTEQAVYASGQPVALVLENHGEAGIHYNLCFSSPEALTQGRIIEPEEGGLICTAVLHRLQPGEQATFAYPFRAEPGRYLFSTTIELPGGSREVIETPPVEVR